MLKTLQFELTVEECRRQGEPPSARSVSHARNTLCSLVQKKGEDAVFSVLCRLTRQDLSAFGLRALVFAMSRRGCSIAALTALEHVVGLLAQVDATALDTVVHGLPPSARAAARKATTCPRQYYREWYGTVGAWVRCSGRQVSRRQEQQDSAANVENQHRPPPAAPVLWSVLVERRCVYCGSRFSPKYDDVEDAWVVAQNVLLLLTQPGYAAHTECAV